MMCDSPFSNLGRVEVYVDADDCFDPLHSPAEPFTVRRLFDYGTTAVQTIWMLEDFVQKNHTQWVFERCMELEAWSADRKNEHSIVGDSEDSYGHRKAITICREDDKFDQALVHKVILALKRA
jgi:hypothetical protein